jgi:hypothetical protein
LLPDAEETTKWSAPAYTIGGKILLVMAAFKAHAALNFWRGQELRGDEAATDAMGQFGKLTAIGDLPPEAELDSLILEAAKLEASAPAPRKTKSEPKPPAELHPEFAAALDAAPKARARSRASRPAPSGIISTGSPKRSSRQRGPSGSTPPLSG